MAVHEAPVVVETGPTTKAEERRALTVGCGAHALHDGYTDLIYVVLPLWQAEFGLSYAAVGLLRTAYTGTMALLQIPATLLAERIGAGFVLASGTALAGLCFCLAGLSTGFAFLLPALLLGGLGASVQHPLASALVARAFAGPRSLNALGTYNFSGDLGKMVIPALAALMLLVLPWRTSLGILGALGFLAAAALLVLMPRGVADRVTAEAGASKAPATGAARTDTRGFSLLLALGAIDSITRAGFMVFLPFLMIGKGANVTTAGIALTVLFVGGATGKLVCARLGARFGIVPSVVITQVLTTAGMLAVLYLPLAACFAVLPIVGAVLNGTSSLTYGSVPQLVTAEARSRAFGIFYTGTLGAGAAGPIIGGVIGDLVGPANAVVAVALLVLATLPLAFLLRPHLRAAAAHG